MTRAVRAWIEHAFRVVYESRFGMIALLHRLELEHRKPQGCLASSTRSSKGPSSTPTLRC
jgi:hypothetical protein